MPLIDLSAPAPRRVQQFSSVQKAVLARSDPGGTAASTVESFLLHVAWHESARLTTRTQWQQGPARGLFQMEPVRVREAIEYARTRGFETALVVEARTDVTTLRAAAVALPTTGTTWPSGSLAEQWLLTHDEFAILLARIALKKIPIPIPSAIELQAHYWADHWKRVFPSPAARTQALRTFRDESLEVDTLLTQSTSLY